MKIEGKIPALFVIVLAWIVIISSCANPGMPQGGPKDTIPPVLLKTEPVYKSTNYKGDDVRLTFNEYLAIDKISEELVISPPMKKKPLIRSKSKTLVIDFNEDLKDSTTYSLDFKNSVADNNERNELENFRFSFSTGPNYDSLRVAGRLMKAFNLAPIEKGLVMLHKNLHDSAIYKVEPNYIAKTNVEGVYMIDNVAPGKYHIFAVMDGNNNFLYDEGAEEIAFADSIVVPFAEFHEEVDTVFTETDTIVVFGHTDFFPDNVYLRQFLEDIFDQYLDVYNRDTRYKCTFVFNESVRDSFELNIVGHDVKDWYQIEYDEDVDSLIVWIADTTLAALDTLLMEVGYLQLDTLEQLYFHRDTVEMNFVDKNESAQSKKKKGKDDEDDEEPEPVVQFTFKNDVGGTTIELNKNFGILAPEPILSFDSTKILLYLDEDTLKQPLKFEFFKDTLEYRKFNVVYNWEPEIKYTLEIDSAAATNIYGITSKKLKATFSGREEDYYGTVSLNLTNVNVPVIVQLLTNNDQEKVVLEKFISEDGKVTFDFLKPEKYKIKFIYDENDNGKWDTGSNQDKYQPEWVTYLNEVVKVKGNWEIEMPFDLRPNPNFIKNIRDLEEEERLRKEAERKALMEQQQQQEQPTDQMQNFIR
jgi:hypothetical protein